MRFVACLLQRVLSNRSNGNGIFIRNGKFISQKCLCEENLGRGFFSLLELTAAKPSSSKSGRERSQIAVARVPDR